MIQTITAMIIALGLYSQPYTPDTLLKDFSNFQTFKKQVTFGNGMYGNEVYEGDHEGSLKRTIKTLVYCTEDNNCRLLYFKMIHPDGKKYILYSKYETFL